MDVVIWKYPIPTGYYHHKFELELPKGATIMCVKWVGKEAVLYTQHDPLVTKEVTTRQFVSLGTGAEFSLQGMTPIYVGTVVQDDPVMALVFVWHIYELYEVKPPIDA